MGIRSVVKWLNLSKWKKTKEKGLHTSSHEGDFVSCDSDPCYVTGNYRQSLGTRLAYERSLNAFKTQVDMAIRDMTGRCHAEKKAVGPLAPIIGVYDFSWIANASKLSVADRVLLVDVGGGSGRAAQAICESTDLSLARRMLGNKEPVISKVDESGTLPGWTLMLIEMHKRTSELP
ncbi:hypothetical protein BDP55DRAFT_722042 [Colletotrichum godetiae]|uniref:O-methyltransferase n=1 Tax=Colletotrichum godetiae TaxID=1209918 RepID=A0AAJ0A8Q9_9PEZI|nr:uncharacterized protein BDP55DRAFT_722042 [Colletotrichum godetiae]KAK1656605.1 hypothetical protein BDP55DRAFT_722042 [Colletotrichum godetiae]